MNVQWTQVTMIASMMTTTMMLIDIHRSRRYLVRHRHHHHHRRRRRRRRRQLPTLTWPRSGVWDGVTAAHRRGAGATCVRASRQTVSVNCFLITWLSDPPKSTAPTTTAPSTLATDRKTTSLNATEMEYPVFSITIQYTVRKHSYRALSCERNGRIP